MDELPRKMRSRGVADGRWWGRELRWGNRWRLWSGECGALARNTEGARFTVTPQLTFHPGRWRHGCGRLRGWCWRRRPGGSLDNTLRMFVGNGRALSGDAEGSLSAIAPELTRDLFRWRPGRLRRDCAGTGVRWGALVILADAIALAVIVGIAGPGGRGMQEKRAQEHYCASAFHGPPPRSDSAPGFASVSRGRLRCRGRCWTGASHRRNSIPSRGRGHSVRPLSRHRCLDMHRARAGQDGSSGRQGGQNVRAPREAVAKRFSLATGWTGYPRLSTAVLGGRISCPPSGPERRLASSARRRRRCRA
jgi:hypothetical protein